MARGDVETRVGRRERCRTPIEVLSRSLRQRQRKPRPRIRLALAEIACLWPVHTDTRPSRHQTRVDNEDPTDFRQPSGCVTSIDKVPVKPTASGQEWLKPAAVRRQYSSG